MRKLESGRENAFWKKRADIEIRKKLENLEELNNAEIVAGYMPMKGEVDLTPLLANLAESGKKICLPRSAQLPKDEKAVKKPLDNGLNVNYVLAGISPEAFDESSKNDFLPKGAFGISEPPSTAETVPNSDVDVWLVPALAFDQRGVRLGRGGGFYDRFLAESAGFKIGVGYDCVIMDELPCDDWDQRMDLIVTERRLLWIFGRK